GVGFNYNQKTEEQSLQTPLVFFQKMAEEKTTLSSFLPENSYFSRGDVVSGAERTAYEKNSKEKGKEDKASCSHPRLPLALLKIKAHLLQGSCILVGVSHDRLHSSNVGKSEWSHGVVVPRSTMVACADTLEMGIPSTISSPGVFDFLETLELYC
ncbi:hypothetical protein STEG23_004253, partial [Scotinomys teguina]